MYCSSFIDVPWLKENNVSISVLFLSSSLKWGQFLCCFFHSHTASFAILLAHSLFTNGLFSIWSYIPECEQECLNCSSEKYYYKNKTNKYKSPLQIKNMLGRVKLWIKCFSSCESIFFSLNHLLPVSVAFYLKELCFSSLVFHVFYCCAS